MRATCGRTKQVYPSALAALGVGWAALMLFPAGADQETRPHAGMMRYPAISATHIAFGYANNIWLVPRTGGTAGIGEGGPTFHPDGVLEYLGWKNSVLYRVKHRP